MREHHRACAEPDLGRSDLNDVTAARAERDRRIFELRALGRTHQAIADEIGCARQTVTRVLNPSVRESQKAWQQANADHRRAWDLEYQRRNAERLREYRAAYTRANAERKAAYDREYRAANADRIREYQFAYRETNAERVRERGQRYREANSDQIRERKRQRWAASADELNARRRASYDDQERERLRKYRQANIEAHRAIGARRKTRGSRGMDGIDRLLSVEYRKAITGDACTYCGAPGEHDDHKLPLARGGTDHWWNLHRTCRECNQRKHLMTHEEFLASGKVPLTAAS